MQMQCQLTEASPHLLACINDQVQRLTSLTLMHVHYDHTISYDEVVAIFARLHRRRLELNSLVSPNHS